MAQSVSEEEPRVRVCPYCYSPEITEKVLIGGPMAQLDNDDGTYRCLKCGRSAVPLDFAGWDEYQAFIDSRMVSVPEERAMEVLPLLPTLFEGNFEDSSIASIVTSIRWEGELRLGPEREALIDNWKRAEKQLGSKAGCLLDLYGIMEGRPNLDGVQRVLRRRNEVMLDIGIGNEQDVFDSFTMGASRVLAMSIGMNYSKVLGKVLDMTDECIPCLCYTDKVIWHRARGNPSDLDECLGWILGLGYKQVCLMDLNRLGRSTGPDLDIVERASKIGLKVWLAGGIRFEDVATLPEAVVGALLDPTFITDTLQM